MGDTDPDVEAAVVQLARWAAAAKADDAADSRMRQRFAQQQAEDEATLASVLVGLAERGSDVAVHTRSGSTIRGTVAGTGADYVALVHADHLTLVPLAAVGWVRPDGAAPAAAFADRASPAGRLVGVLAGMLEDGPEIRVVAGGEAIAGALVAVGEDVLTLRPAGAAMDQGIYVPVASVSEVSLRLSG